MRARLPVTAVLMLTLIACGDGGADGGATMNATGGESPTTSGHR